MFPSLHLRRHPHMAHILTWNLSDYLIGNQLLDNGLIIEANVVRF